MKKSVFRTAKPEELYPLILSLSLLLLLMFSGMHWFTRIPLAALSISAFIWKDLVHQSKFWFLAFCFVAFEVAFFWYDADNHKFLTAYWLLSLSIVCGLPYAKRMQTLAIHARAYLVLCMGFAVAWKFINKDFTDHSFFEFTLLTDGRFQYFTKYLTGMTLKDLNANQDLLGGIMKSSQYALALKKNATVSQLAALMTYFVLAIELMIPLSFLFFPKRTFPHLILISFMLATYPIATVVGFAWLLIIFAISLCDRPSQAPLRMAYCVLFVLTQSFRSEMGPLFEFLLGN